MRRLLTVTAAALATVATPAMARDGSGYVGVEAGLLFPRDVDFDGIAIGEQGGLITFEASDVGEVDLKTGHDIDLIAGYDFGMFRLEGELAHKGAKVDSIELDPDFQDVVEEDLGRALTDDDFDLGRARVTSGMLNALVDFGGDAGLGAYAGAGIGIAKVKALGDSDSGLAWQLIAGLRTAISDNIDLGLKYRYFRSSRLNFDNDAFEPGDLAADEFALIMDNDRRFSSHSLLASLIFNFGAAAEPAPLAAPPPPPPPAAPATQTCPDGSVIDATAACPPPPPPPPPPPVERGERGR
jgi:opacity protein-like surface antigen